MIPDSVLLAALVVLVLWWCDISERRRAVGDGVLEEDEPRIVDAQPSGLKFERRFNEEGSTWQPMEEAFALAVLRCAFFDVPKVIEEMKRGETRRTRFAEYRLVQ